MSTSPLVTPTGVNRKLVYAALGALASGAFGFAASHFSMVAMVVTGLACTVSAALALAAARYITTKHRKFRDRTTREQRQLQWLAVATVVSHEAVALLWMIQPKAWAMWSLMLLVLFVATAFGPKAKRHHDEHFKTTEVAPHGPNVPAVPSPQQYLDSTDPHYDAHTATPGTRDDTIANFEQVLRGCNLSHLIVGDEYEFVQDPKDNRIIGYRFEVRVPANMINSGKGGLSEDHAEPIAASIGEQERKRRRYLKNKGVPPQELPKLSGIQASWVSVVKQSQAGMWLITVMQEDILGRLFAFADETDENGLAVPTSIKKPALVGYTNEALPYYDTLMSHGSRTGLSTSGKSSLVSTELAHTTRCPDEVDWLAGVEKMFDLINPWLLPYKGSDLRGPFDWIVVGPEDSARMIATGMWLARWRQAQEYELRRQFKTVIIWLDEASFLLKDYPNSAIALYNGELLDASTLLGNATKGAASARVFFKIVSQRGTNDNWGKDGGTINNNLKEAGVFMSNDKHELGRAFGNWKLTLPRRPGEYWRRPTNGDGFKHLKSPYIQTDDPDKEMLLPNGPFLSDVSWARRFIDNGLDDPSASALGAWYANRRRKVEDVLGYVQNGQSDTLDPEKPHEYVHPVPPQHTPSVMPGSGSSPQKPASKAPTRINTIKAEAEAWAEIAKINRACGLPDNTGLPTNTEPDSLDAAPQRPQIAPPTPGAGLFGGPTANATKKQSRKKNIHTIFQGSASPLDRSEVIDVLVSQYGDTKAAEQPQMVTNAIGELVRESLLIREGSTHRYVVA